MIRAVITGTAGRMGSTLLRAARDADDFEIVGATERPGSAVIGIDAGLAAQLGPLKVPVVDDLRSAIDAGKPAVVIDFTAAEASARHASVCAESGVALVVGSTGFTDSARAAVDQASRRVPIVMAPNMSAGVNVLLRLVRDTARTLGSGYDVEVLEIHHKLKKDAPSGTALRLAEIVAEALGRKPSEVAFARHGEVGPRPAGQIGVQALRGGDVVGEHTVYFLAAGERLELTHRATSRDPFAAGALRAARWIVARTPGLYDMQDVLGLK